MTLVLHLRNGVVPAAAPRLTACEPFERKPQAGNRSVRLDRLNRIRRACWCEAAVPSQQRADEVLVHPYRGDQQVLECCLDHCRTRSSNSSASVRINSRSAASDEFRTVPCSRNTRSRGGSACRFCRKASRTTRLIVLRVTARAANRFATITPSRAVAAVASLAPVARRGELTVSNVPLASCLPLSARLNSAGRCRRAEAGNVARMGVCQRFATAGGVKWRPAAVT